MKNSIILIAFGLVLIFGGLLWVKYWILNLWFLLVPIGGLVIFILGTMKFIKKLENGKS